MKNSRDLPQVFSLVEGAGPRSREAPGADGPPPVFRPDPGGDRRGPPLADGVGELQEFSRKPTPFRGGMKACVPVQWRRPARDRSLKTRRCRFRPETSRRMRSSPWPGKTLKEQEALGLREPSSPPRLLFRQSRDWLARSVPRGTRERGGASHRTLRETVSDQARLAVVVELRIPHPSGVGVSIPPRPSRPGVRVDELVRPEPDEASPETSQSTSSPAAGGGVVLGLAAALRRSATEGDSRLTDCACLPTNGIRGSRVREIRPPGLKRGEAPGHPDPPYSTLTIGAVAG
jgi:hypothetical protein